MPLARPAKYVRESGESSWEDGGPTAQAIGETPAGRGRRIIVDAFIMAGKVGPGKDFEAA
jgi:hypothetical protein